MNFITQYFLNGRYLNLSEPETKKREGKPQSSDPNSTSEKNIKKTIRELSEEDWFTFATINLCTTMFSKTRTEIISENKQVWEDFFSKMRLYGDNTSLRRLMEEMKRDMIGYGSCYIEFVPDEDNTEILDLKKIDSSRMSNAKDRKGNLILDEFGKSIGYVLSLGPNIDVSGKGDLIPEIYRDSVNLNSGDIFLSPERIAEVKLYLRPNSIEPIGLIEPSIEQTKRRRNLETAQVNAIWIRGTAPLFALVGDPTHEPTPQMITDALDSLSDMRHSNASAFPYYIKPDALNVKVDDMATKIMDDLLSASASTANIPLPLVTGRGEATNRATLKTQRELFEDNIQDKIKNFDEDFNLLILDRIARINGYPTAKIKSSSVRLESRDEFAKRLKLYFDMKALSPKEIRMNIKNIEELELDEADYEEYNKQKPIEENPNDGEQNKQSEEGEEDNEDDENKGDDEEDNGNN